MINLEDSGKPRAEDVKAISSWTRLAMSLYDDPTLDRKNLAALIAYEITHRKRKLIINKLASRYCSLTSKEIKNEIERFKEKHNG